MKGFISLIVGLLVTALALTYALWDVDVAEFSALFRSANYWVIAPFLGLLTAHFWLKALRWVAILRPLGRFTPAQVTPAMMIGFGANNVVPAHLGELLRTVVFARRFGKPYSGVLASLVLERIFDVTAILLLYLFAASITRPPTEVLTSVVLIAAGMTAGAFAVILFVLWKPHRVLSMWNRVARWLPAHLQERGETVLQNVVLALSSLKAPGLLIVLLGNSLLQWTLAAGNIWLAMWAFGLNDLGIGHRDSSGSDGARRNGPQCTGLHRTHPSRFRACARSLWGNARSSPGGQHFLPRSSMGASHGYRGRVLRICRITSGRGPTGG